MSSNFNKLPRWLKISLVLGLIAIVNYLPAFDQDFDPFAAYQRGNLSSTMSGILHVSLYPGWPDENDYNFYWEWFTAKQLINGDFDISWHYEDQNLKGQFQNSPLKPQLPLWRWDDRDGGRPLLALSTSPMLYPLSEIYYHTGNLTPFAAFHFWLGLLGGFLLAAKLPLKVRKVGRPVILLLVFIFLPQLRVDFEAAAAWWLVGLALVLNRSVYLRLLSFILVFAMLWLTVGSPTSQLLIGTLCIWWILVEANQGYWRVSTVFKVILRIGLAVFIGLLLAAPQFFPRWFDRMEPYQKPTSGYIALVNPADQLKLVNATRVSETEITYKLSISRNTPETQLTIPERYDKGWAATYRTDVTSNSFEKTRLERSEEGWRIITIPPLADTTSLEIRTVFNPESFQPGILCLKVGLVCLLFILVITSYFALSTKQGFRKKAYLSVGKIGVSLECPVKLTRPGVVSGFVRNQARPHKYSRPHLPSWLK